MIEDVEYLEENSVKNSQVVYVDSRKRDKYLYPTPGEYVISFEQPFKLVYGFDVIDSTIPVTMYNIDKYNNTLYFTVVSKSGSSVVPINSETYFTEISKCASYIDFFNNKSVNTKVVIGNELDLSPFISAVVSPSEDYIVYYRNILTTTEIIKRTTQIDSEFYFFTFNGDKYAIRDTILNQPIIEILDSGDFFLYINNNSVDLVYFEKHYANLSIVTSIQNSGSFIISISGYLLSLELGNYDIISLIGALNDILNNITVDVSSTTPEPKRQAKLQFTSSNFMIMNVANANSKIFESLGFDQYPQTSTNYKGWIIGDNYLIYGSVFDTSINQYKIASPGLISLLGERFAILRIKEVEDHLYSSYAYMAMTPGIGMFKMASSFGGITNLRFDYVTVIQKPFHPIGKLSRLSIRFETSSGDLYDFKGVNHQLLFNIKYYSPARKEKFTKSILNPNYEPDIMKYMIKNKNIENKEESDEEEDFYEDERFIEYKKELNKFKYSNDNEYND